MEKANVRVRRWGNSFGIIIPSDIVKSQNLSENSELEILINTRNQSRAKDIFGILEGKLKRDTKSLLKEVDKDFEK